MDTDTLSPPAKMPLAAELLPPIFAKPAAYLWLWLLPTAVLLALNLQGYSIISGNMDPSQRHLGLMLGLCGLANCLVGSGLYVMRKWIVPTTSGAGWWGLPAVLVQAAYLWFAVSEVDKILPRSVEVWIYPSQRFLFNQFAFAMLPLFLGILQMAGATRQRDSLKAIGVSAGMAIGAPVGLYAVALSLRYFRNPGALSFIVLAILVVTLGVVMFVGIIRGLMLILRLLQRWREVALRIAVIVIGLVLPLGGLYLNRSLPFPEDFQAWEVYALTVINAAILVLASWMQGVRPRLSFNLLCATLPFALYFFVVFLPYTPLSIIAVIVLGAGLLVLAPTFLFTLHLHLLQRARSALPAGERSSARTVVVGIGCFLALPLFFTGRALADKLALTSALDFVMSPSVQTDNSRYVGNMTNLSRALASHRSLKNGIYYPFLSDYYSWLVFDQLVLPDPTLARLEQRFFGSTGASTATDPLRSGTGSLLRRTSLRDRMRLPRAAPLARTAYVSDLHVRSAPNDSSPLVTLTLTLCNSGSAPAEYETRLPLPPGVFVRGFRLEVDGRLVPGRIFEKKTARWVYEMIRDSERRDPGLLFFAKQGELNLQVFPIDAAKPTRVEIDFCIPENVDVQGAPVAAKNPGAVLAWLGDIQRPQFAASTEGGYFSGAAAVIATLPAVERESYLHVIVDRSAKNGFTGDLTEALQTVAKRFPSARQVRLTLANYDVIDVTRSLMPISEWVRRPAVDLDRLLSKAGGLALDVAVAHALRQHRDLDLDRPRTNDLPFRPRIVVLSHHAAPGELSLPVAETWFDLCPSLELEEIGEDKSHVTHHLAAGARSPLVRLGDSMRPLSSSSAVTFKSADVAERIQYWVSEEKRWKDLPAVARPDASSEWSRATSLVMQQQAHARDPGSFRGHLGSLVKASRDSGILLPATSYIVVENAAQWRVLENSEQQKLGENAALEFKEAPAPSGAIVAGLFIVYLCVRHRRQLRVRFYAIHSLQI
ncbi:MAG: MSEP-CTERM sorting domain-containing protein [Opitutus sp.]